MAALMAAGISRWRVIVPLILATLAISLLAAVNREVGIPAVRDQLCRRSRDWVGDGGRELHPVFDNRTGIWVGGQRTYSADRRISSPTFRIPPGIEGFGRRLVARQAFYRDEEKDRPSGYLLQGVTEPPNLAERPSLELDGRLVVHSPRDTQWLGPDECFVVSNVNFEHLESGLDWYQYSSTAELIQGLRNQSIELASDVRILLHSRLIQPLLDMTLVLLGLPIVLSRGRRNVFVAVGLCVLLVTGFSIVVLGCQALGTNYLITPALAAWCPLMIFVPSAVAFSGPLRT
jgi:lipopolysaccharide export system permease protein